MIFFLFFKIDFLYDHFKIIQRYKKILIWIKEKNFKNSKFFKAFLKGKNKYALIIKFT
jgi:hypothetical protein